VCLRTFAVHFYTNEACCDAQKWGCNPHEQAILDFFAHLNIATKVAKVREITHTKTMTLVTLLFT
jgi:hypothetical protein